MFTQSTVFARVSVFALCVSAFHFIGCAEFEEDIPSSLRFPIRRSHGKAQMVHT